MVIVSSTLKKAERGQDDALKLQKGQPKIIKLVIKTRGSDLLLFRKEPGFLHCMLRSRPLFKKGIII